MDLIKQLGAMALGSRLKRLTVRMNKDVSRIYRDLDLEFEARWFPVAYLLFHESPCSITEIADALNYSHTAIKNFVNEMNRRGLLDSTPDASDKRRRIVRLSHKGREVVEHLIPVWQEVHVVADELVNASEPNLLASIESIELQLDRKEVYPRILERLRPLLLDAIEILEYRPAYKKHFKSLNYEWLKKQFQVEPADERLLSDPKRHIINKGGFILFARLHAKIVGTAALIRHDGDLFEIAKMAVTQKARRRLVGTKLTMEILKRAKAIGARRIYLETHPKLKAAQRLYKSMGFERIDESPIPHSFDRRRIVMKFDILSAAFPRED